MRMPSSSTSLIVTMWGRVRRNGTRLASGVPKTGRRARLRQGPSLAAVASLLIFLYFGSGFIGSGLAKVQAVPVAGENPGEGLGSERPAGPQQATATPSPQRTPPPLPTCEPNYCRRPAASLYDMTDSVFSGRVIEIEQLGPEESWWLRIRLAVEEIWKGPRGRELTVRIDRSNWTCHWRSQLGEVGARAMVFANIEPDGSLRIRWCHGPAEEDELRAVLGPGEPAGARQPAGGLGGAIRDIALAADAGPTRGPDDPLDIAGLTWLAQGHRLLPETGLLDSSGSWLDWPEPVSAMARDGDWALVASDRVLYLIDLGAAGGPKFLSHQSLEAGIQGQILGLMLFGERAILHNRQSEDGGITWQDLIVVIDLASGRTLSYDLIGEPDAQVIDMLRMGDRLVVSSRLDDQAEGRIHVIGMSRPGGAPSEPPTELARVEHPAAGLLADARDDDGQGFLTYHDRQLARLAVAVQGPPSIEQSWSVEGGRFERAEALAVDAAGQIHLQVHAWRSRDLVGHLLGLAEGDSGQLVVQSPIVHAAPRRFDAGLAVSADHLWLGDASGLARIGPSVGPDRVTHARTPVDVDAVAAGPDWLLAGSRQAGLLVYDRQDPLAPIHRAHIPSDAPSNHLLAGADRDYAIWQTDRVRLVDLRNPDAPTLRDLGPSDVSEPPIWALSEDLLAVLHPDAARLSLYDLREAGAPRLADSADLDPQTDWQALAFDGARLHLAYHPGPPVNGPIGPPGLPSLELASFEVALEAGEPRLTRGQDRTLLDTLVRDTSLLSMVLSGDRLWLLHRGIEGRRSEAMLAGFDLSDPNELRMHARVAIPGAAGPILLDGQRLYVSSQGTVQGIHVVDLASPDAPQLASPLARGRGRVTVADGHAYVANGPAGLWIYPPESSLPPSPTPLPVTPTTTPTPTDSAPTAEATTPTPLPRPIYLPLLHRGQD